MKETLQIDGKKRTFSNVENISIEENVKSSKEDKIYEVAQKPTEGKWFKVKPLAIDQTLFKEKREDGRQEKKRQLILEAFEELKKNPKEYGRNFETMMPKKIWKQKTVADLREIACNLGDHEANWVEQTLEWAQRIANGESWEDLCNKPDTANWLRAVIWKNGYTRLIGGSVRINLFGPATNVFDFLNLFDYENANNIVPLVARYEE